jgi:hypothetical protein
VFSPAVVAFPSMLHYVATSPLSSSRMHNAGKGKEGSPVATTLRPPRATPSRAFACDAPGRPTCAQDRSARRVAWRDTSVAAGLYMRRGCKGAGQPLCGPTSIGRACDRIGRSTFVSLFHSRVEASWRMAITIGDAGTCALSGRDQVCRAKRKTGVRLPRESNNFKGLCACSEHRFLASSTFIQ